MLSIILFLAVLAGLGLRLARWIDGLPVRPPEAVRPEARPARPGAAGLFGTGL
jgi:hypothetical protein